MGPFFILFSDRSQTVPFRGPPPSKCNCPPPSYDHFPLFFAYHSYQGSFPRLPSRIGSLLVPFDAFSLRLRFIFIFGVCFLLRWLGASSFFVIPLLRCHTFFERDISLAILSLFMLRIVPPQLVWLCYAGQVSPPRSPVSFPRRVLSLPLTVCPSSR